MWHKLLIILNIYSSSFLSTRVPGFYLPMATWNRLHFSDVLASSWPRSDQWDLVGSGAHNFQYTSLKTKGLLLMLFPLLTRWSSYFGLWCGSFMLRMAGQQNRRSLGSLIPWNHYHQPSSISRACTWERNIILPCLSHFHFEFLFTDSLT